MLVRSREYSWRVLVLTSSYFITLTYNLLPSGKALSSFVVLTVPTALFMASKTYLIGIVAHYRSDFAVPSTQSSGIEHFHANDSSLCAELRHDRSKDCARKSAPELLAQAGPRVPALSNHVYNHETKARAARHPTTACIDKRSQRYFH